MIRFSGFLLLVAGTAFLILLFSFWSYKGRFWGDWYPLVISSSHVDDELELFLSDISGGEMISESNSLLEFNGFGESESLRISELGSRNAPYEDDPRLDPYMTGSLSYFNNGQYKIYYLPAIRSALAYDFLIRQSPLSSGKELFLADAGFSIYPAVLFVLVLLLLCAGCFRFCIPAVGFLSLGFFVFSAGDGHLLLFLVLAALPVRYMMDGAKPLFRVIFLLVLVWGVFVVQADLRYVSAVLAMGFISLGVSIIVPAKRRIVAGRTGRQGRKVSGRDHVLFEPVPLTAAVKAGPSKRSGSLLPTLVAVFSLLLLFASGRGEQSLPVGIPTAESSGLSWEFESLSMIEESAEYPGVSAFFRHRAYQDSFMYGGSYSMPRLGSTLSVDDFVFEDGAVINRPRIVLSYDTDWFRSVLSDMSASGPGRLMAGEEFIPGIMRSNSYIFGNSTGVLLLAGLCLLLIFYIRIFGMHPDLSAGSDRFSGKFVFRRKQQAA